MSIATDLESVRAQLANSNRINQGTSEMVAAAILEYGVDVVEPEQPHDVTQWVGISVDAVSAECSCGWYTESAGTDESSKRLVNYRIAKHKGEKPVGAPDFADAIAARIAADGLHGDISTEQVLLLFARAAREGYNLALGVR